MKTKIVKRRNVTLVEMMIVMFLIAMITGALAYNYRGSLEEGKAFKTRLSIEKLEQALNLLVAENPDLEDDIRDNWQEELKKSPMVKNPKDLYTDGWGKEYKVKIDEETGYVKVSSEALTRYEAAKKK